MLQRLDPDYLSGFDEVRVPGCVGGLDQYDPDYLQGLDMDPMTPVLVVGGIAFLTWLTIAGLTTWGAYRVVKKITD